MSRPAPGLPDPDDRVHVHRLGWVVALVLAAGVVGLVSRGADRVPDPYLLEPGARGHVFVPDGPSRVAGFDQVAVRTRPADGGTRSLCMLLADTPERRLQGLSDLPELAGYDGMLFVYEQTGPGAFHMRGVQFPLSLAVFDDDGTFLAALDMPPCPPGTEDCPAYDPGVPWRFAVEAELGRLPELGIGPGGTIEPGDSCPAG